MHHYNYLLWLPYFITECNIFFNLFRVVMGLQNTTKPKCLFLEKKTLILILDTA